ncbi:EI24 domain-containing protein [Danxiaibacter flavus]|uniref:EI24 domain-containing protein n=1 Tax=Danxiaibacter flavus TaxID=3049108 RepID=A0ABV3ZDG8_9BACT|nr:EI24 domain-containing protein [Chitinophagaceae bacterium DXS]
MLKEIIIAIQSYFKAHQFIRENKLWKWILIPGFIYAILFIVSMYFFGKSANNAIEWIKNVTHLTVWLEKMQSSFLSFLFAISGLILWLVLMLFYFSLFKYLWLIVGSPVFAYLSEKTTSILEGRDFPFSFRQLAHDIVRGIKIALRNTLWQTIYTISIVFLSFIPLVGWAMPMVAMFLECYYYGFSMLDYTCERQKMSASESIYFINNHRGLAIGNGLIFYLMHLVPVIGWVFAPAYAVIAATLSLREEKA